MSSGKLAACSALAMGEKPRDQMTDGMIAKIR